MGPSQSVKDVWMVVSIPKEGRLAFFYLDVKNLVTIGVGNLFDTGPDSTQPPASVYSLPLRHPDGRLATRDEIAEDWHRVKARKDLSQKGGGVYRNVAKLRLSETDIDTLVFNVLDTQFKIMLTWCPALTTWCDDAQLGMCSMAWALGPLFDVEFKRFKAAALREDFRAMAAECDMKGGGTIPSRNAMNRQCFVNAAYVKEAGLDPRQLYYPVNLESAGAQNVGGVPAPVCSGCSVHCPPTHPSLQKIPNTHDLTTVRGYQARLKELGFDPGAVDGILGHNTKYAIMQFQKAAGLVVDGLVGPKTRLALTVG